MTDATTIHGATIYTDPERIKLRPKGVMGAVWWEECAPDDPEGVEYVPASALAAALAAITEYLAARREVETTDVSSTRIREAFARHDAAVAGLRALIPGARP